MPYQTQRGLISALVILKKWVEASDNSEVY